MRFLRAVLSAVVATLPVLVVLLVPALVRGDVDGGSAAGVGTAVLNAAFIAAIILVPRVNGRLDPEVPDWTSSTAMAATARVWRSRIWLALLTVLALLAILAAGQTAAYLMSQSAPAVTDGALDYSRFLAQELVVYLGGYVLSLTTYVLLMRVLARSAA
jgi:Na+-driven multidrug efflux pump